MSNNNKNSHLTVLLIKYLVVVSIIYCAVSRNQAFILFVFCIEILQCFSIICIQYSCALLCNVFLLVTALHFTQETAQLFQDVCMYI